MTTTPRTKKELERLAADVIALVTPDLLIESASIQMRTDWILNGLDSHGVMTLLRINGKVSAKMSWLGLEPVTGKPADTIEAAMVSLNDELHDDAEKDRQESGSV